MAENLWALREQKKMSVAALANRAGLPIGLIIEYEAGQRSIDPRHLSRLARALYVEESEIRLQSERRVTAPPSAPVREASREVARERPFSAEQHPAPGEQPPRPRERGPRPPRPTPRPPAPARPSQIVYLEGLLRRLGRSVEDLQTQVGKPLAELDRPTATDLIKQLQAEVAQTSPANRHRAYLPEAVDTYEERYLTQLQQGSALVHFRLFNGDTTAGQIVGFGPYSITIRQPAGGETTLNKLAIVSYRAESQQQAEEPKT